MDIVPMDFAGTLPGWVTATGILTLLGIVLKNQFSHRKLTLDHNADQVTAYYNECARLRGEIRDMAAKLVECEEDCAGKIKTLHEEVHGLRRQHVQEQISLINSIIDSVDSPLLKSLLRSMESVQRALPTVETIGREVEDEHSKG